MEILFLIVGAIYLKHFLNSVLFPEYNKIQHNDAELIKETKINNFEIFNDSQEKAYIGFVQSNTQNQNLNKIQNTLLSTITNNEPSYNKVIEKKIFQNEEEMEQYYINHPKNLIAGIIFNNENLTSYTLRVSGNTIPDISLETSYEDSSLIKHNASDYRNLYSSLQMIIDEVILREISNNENLNIYTAIDKLKSPQLEEDKFYPYYPLIVVFLIEFIMVISIIYTVPIIVHEKENKLKEYIISCGVPPIIYWLSWIISNYLILTIYAILINSVITFLPSLLFSNDTAFYTWSHVALSFVVLISYALSLTNLSFLLAVLQKNLGTVTITSYTLLFLFSVIYTGFHFSNQIIQTIGSFLFSSVATGRIFIRMLTVSRYSLPYAVKIFSDKEILISLIGLFSTTFLYFGLAILFDYILSEENQSIIPWKIQLHKNRDFFDSYRASTWGEDLEPYLGNESVTVELKNVSKVYHYKKRQIPAVDHLCLRGYKNEVVAIVGPNESGKTTLYNMLTGLIHPTHGTIKYMGNKFKPRNSSVQSCIGFCPSHNALIKPFSVIDNIKFFNRFKQINMTSIKEILTAVNLENKKNTPVEHLTKDQRQMLCIAIALSGNHPILLFDEPTKNVSKLNKKIIGLMITFFKKKKTVIMTTSDIKEAELIADRTFFYSYGKIRCGGSNIYLKEHFNLDYELKVETNNQAYVNAMIHSIIPTAKYLPHNIFSFQTSNDRPNLHTWLLPLNTVDQFNCLFKELNNLDTNNDVEKCYLKPPSLSDLYITLMNKEEEEKIVREELNERHNDNDIEVEYYDSQDNSHQHFALNISSINGSCDNQKLIVKDYTALPEPLPTQHTSAFAILKQLIQIKFKIYFRKKSFIIYSYILPVMVSFILFTYLRINPYNKVVYPSKKLISPATFPKNTQINYDLSESNLKFLSTDVVQDYARNNTVEWFNELDYRDLIQWNFISSISGKFNKENTLDEYIFDLYFNETMLHSLPISINYISNIVAASQNNSNNTRIEMNIHPFPYIDINTCHFTLINACFIINLLMIFSSLSKSNVIAQERENLMINQLRINGIHRNLYWLSTLITDIILYMITCLLMYFIGVICYYEPFLNLKAFSVILVVILLNSLSTMLFQYSIGFIFTKPKYIYSNTLITNIILLVIWYILSLSKCIIEKEESIPDFNTIFKKDSLYIQMIIVLFIPFTSFANVIFYVSWIGYINKFNPTKFPLTYQTYLNNSSGIHQVWVAAFSASIIYYFVLMTFDRYIIERRKIKKLFDNNDLDVLLHEERYSNNYPVFIDESAYNEYELTDQHYQEFPLSIRRLNKEYSISPESCDNTLLRTDFAFGEAHRSIYTEDITYARTVIENVTFHVDKNECFGLLGPDGVGKSTIINTLTGISKPTFGDIFYDGKNIDDLPYLNIGYCHERDVLWDELTLREHLEFFLTVRGYPTHRIPKEAEHYLRYCHLKRQQHQRISQIHPSLRRKLCILLAFCGYPKIVILDEPTRNLNTMVKHDIWKWLKEMKHRQRICASSASQEPNDTTPSYSSVLLATNDMEEAEAICDRVTFLHNGIVSNNGPPKTITENRVHCYVIDIKTKSRERLQRIMFDDPQSFCYGFPCSFDRYSRQHFTLYLIDRHPVGDMFTYLEKLKSDGIIDDYALSTPSLETLNLILYKKTIAID